MITERQKAEQQGFIVDTHCYPWLAYKGPRFAPTFTQLIETDKECERLELLTSLRNRLRIAIQTITDYVKP